MKGLIMAVLNGRLPSLFLKYIGLNPSRKKLYVRSAKMWRGLDVGLRIIAMVLGLKPIDIMDAYRSYTEQKALFLSRYVTIGNLNGRRWYDRRWWNGQWWYRISSAGTVAVPSLSNHGWATAVDLGFPLNSSATTAHAMARWLLPLLGFSWAEGRANGEAWHWVWVGFPDRPTLKIGSSGNVVKLWQLLLRLAGIKVQGAYLKADGDYGPKTAAGTKLYQRKHGIRQNGIVDSTTWRRARLA